NQIKKLCDYHSYKQIIILRLLSLDNVYPASNHHHLYLNNNHDYKAFSSNNNSKILLRKQ
ncbi:hypothetical protein DERP_015408, partial [Dermatophagoides pteronyssinus]